MTSLLARLGLALFLLLSVVGADVAVAQDDDEYVPDDGAEAGGEDGGTGLSSDVDFGAVDDLLKAEEEVLSAPETYTYDPGARRDPFRSLLQRRDQNDDQGRQERPEGKPGLLIDEIDLQGIFVLQDGPVAQVEAANSDTSYLLSPGDELWDGDVVRITLDEVIFKQSVRDPTALKPFREVVKRLQAGKRN
ncbi:MAG: hypothetical protein AAGM22_00820 [Acidobacteriota bacterium]